MDADDDGKIVEYEVMTGDLTRILEKLPTLRSLLQDENPYNTSDQEESVADLQDPEDIMDDYTEDMFDGVLSEDLEHFVNSPKQTETSRDELWLSFKVLNRLQCNRVAIVHVNNFKIHISFESEISDVFLAV